MTSNFVSMLKKKQNKAWWNMLTDGRWFTNVDKEELTRVVISYFWIYQISFGPLVINIHNFLLGLDATKPVFRGTTKRD